MDWHESRLPALPHDEAGLREAFLDGRLDEHAWCELKRELPPPSKGANLELARDLASLAVDGGTLYIGVDEEAPGGNPLRPQPLAGLRERVDQIARTRVSPALFVETYEIPASGEAGYGYLEVVVRASADAPHQVEGIYYGRSDTGKCRLADPQVERLMREREQQRPGAEDGLRAVISADPYQGDGQAYPHLFIYARPGVRRAEMSRDVIVADQRWQLLLSRLTGVMNDVISPMYAATGRRAGGGMLEAVIRGPRLITGGVSLSSWPVGQDGLPGEQHHQELRIDEDGDLSFYHAHAGSDSEPVNGVSRKVLFTPAVVGATREFIAVTVAISHGMRVPGTWHLGIALTGIRGYSHRETDWPDYGPPCTDTAYVRVERFDLAAMERLPGGVTGKLLGRLLRGLRADTHPDIKALLTDPAVAGTARTPDDEV